MARKHNPYPVPVATQIADGGTALQGSPGVSPVHYAGRWQVAQSYGAGGTTINMPATVSAANPIDQQVFQPETKADHNFVRTALRKGKIVSVSKGWYTWARKRAGNPQQVTQRELARHADRLGLAFWTQAPGDGIRRYFFYHKGHYGNEIHVSKGIKAASEWLDQYGDGKYRNPVALIPGLDPQGFARGSAQIDTDLHNAGAKVVSLNPREPAPSHCPGCARKLTPSSGIRDIRTGRLLACSHCGYDFRAKRRNPYLPGVQSGSDGSAQIDADLANAGARLRTLNPFRAEEHSFWEPGHSYGFYREHIRGYTSGIGDDSTVRERVAYILRIARQSPRVSSAQYEKLQRYAQRELYRRERPLSNPIIPPGSIAAKEPAYESLRVMAGTYTGQTALMNPRGKRRRNPSFAIGEEVHIPALDTYGTISDVIQQGKFPFGQTYVEVRKQDGTKALLRPSAIRPL